MSARAFVDYLIPWGDDGEVRAVVVPPAECAMLWRRFGAELERLRRDRPDSEFSVVLYALRAAAKTHEARAGGPARGTERGPVAGRVGPSSPVKGDPSLDDMTTTEVADLLDRDPSYVRRRAREGRLAGRKVGRDWVFPRHEVENLH